MTTYTEGRWRAKNFLDKLLCSSRSTDSFRSLFFLSRWWWNLQFLLGRRLWAANIHLSLAESELFRTTMDTVSLHDCRRCGMPGDISRPAWWVGEERVGFVAINCRQRAATKSCNVRGRHDTYNFLYKEFFSFLVCVMLLLGSLQDSTSFRVCHILSNPVVFRWEYTYFSKINFIIFFTRPNNNADSLLHRQDGNFVSIRCAAFNGLGTLSDGR